MRTPSQASAQSTGRLSEAIGEGLSDVSARQPHWDQAPDLVRSMAHGAHGLLRHRHSV